MPKITVNNPSDFTTEQARYLNEMQRKVNTAFGATGKYVPRSILPAKPSNGDIYYFDIPLAPDILWEGFWGYAGGQWIYLGSDYSVTAAYGGIRTPAPVAIPDLGAAWYTIIEMTEGAISVPRGIVQNTANSSLQFPSKGIYAASLNIVLTHVEENATTTFYVRAFSPSGGYSSASLPVVIPRNASATDIDISSLLLEIDDVNAGLDVVIQIGNGEIITGVTLVDAYFSAHSISEKQI